MSEIDLKLYKKLAAENEVLKAEHEVMLVRTGQLIRAILKDKAD